MKRGAAIGLLLLMLLSAVLAFHTITDAQTATSGTVIIGVQADTYIEAGKDKNYNGYSLYVGRMGSGGTGVAYRSLLYFNISSIPGPSMITKARLCLVVERDLFNNDTRLLFMAVTAHWDEDEVTWFKRTASEPWSQAGGDFERTPHAEIIVPTGLKRDDVICADVTELVRKWRNGELENHGVMLIIPPPSETGPNPGILELINEEYGASPFDNARLYVSYTMLSLPAGIIITKPNPFKPGVSVGIINKIGMALVLANDTLQVRQGSFNKTLVSLVTLTGSGSVNLHATSTEPGVTASFNTTSISAGQAAEVTVTVDSSVPPGEYDVMIEGHNPSTGKTCATTLTVKVTPAAQPPPTAAKTFSLAPSTTRLQVAQGSNSSMTIRLISVAGYSHQVTLSITGLPPGATATFKPPSGTPTFTTTLEVHASKSTPPGSYTTIVTATGADGTTKNFTLTLLVQKAVTTCGTITATVTPLQVTLAPGNSSNITVSVSASNPSCKVRIKAATPPGISASPTPRECTAPCTSTVQVTAAPSASGTRTIKIRVEDAANPATHDEKTVKVTVTHKPSARFDFKLEASPSQIEIYQGETATATITLKTTSGIPRQVILQVSGCPSGATCTLSKTTAKPPDTVTLTIDAGSAKGTYTITITGKSGPKTRQASITITIKEKRCFIATATYGSEVAEEVQFLRNFRDNIVLSTQAGKAFYKVFDPFYYSWSPYIAQAIIHNPWTKTPIKLLLYPLLASLKAAAAVAAPLTPLSPEAAVIAAGTLASLLIGAFYAAPILLLIFLRYRKPNLPSPRAPAVVFGIALALLVLLDALAQYAEAILPAAAAFYVLTAASLGALTPIYIFRKYFTQS